jgi:hypothetical protein
MYKIIKYLKGFFTPQIAVLVSVALITGIVGWVIYNHYGKSPAAIVLERQQYIDKVVSGVNFQNYSSLSTTLYKKGYITASLYGTTTSLSNSYTNGTVSSNPAYDQYICVDQVPSSFTYGAATLGSSENTAILPVNVFVPNDISPTRYSASWVNVDGTWKLNSANC